MLHGTPVVATDAGGTREQFSIEDSDCCMLVAV